MNPVRKSLAVALLAGGSIAGGFAGSVLVRDGNSVHAQEAPAQNAPAQGNVATKPQVSEQDLAHVETLATVFRKVGKSIEPAVVNITVLKSGGPGRTAAYDEMLRRFFPDRDGDGKPDLPEGFDDGGFGPDGAAPDGGGEAPEEFRAQGTGSGVIMEVQGADAFILTNNHVAGGATEIIVTLADGRRVENGTVVGTDPKTDLAIVKINAEGLLAAPWGDSDRLEKGDWIMAFGSPFGYVGSMTHGIVSALNRRAGILGQNGYEQFIQVDAPINPGNSGGPLVNVRGEVVGINTAIASRNGGFQGIGFAIPSNQAKVVYTALKNNGRVVRGWIGVAIQDVTAEPGVTKRFGYEAKTGVLVKQTFHGTPAIGKLQAGDIITAMAGKPVKDTQELRNTIAATPPGTEMAMTVFRDGKTQEVTLKIGEQPEDMTVAAGGPKPQGDPSASSDENRATAMGMKLVTPNDQVAQQFSLGETRQGALVTDIDRNSPAARSGLKPGDVITRINTTDVLTARAAAEALEQADKSEDITLYVSDSQGSRFEIIKPKKDAK
jgi:serine protease Do